MNEKDRADKIAKALTHIVYRNGYIEDLHSNPTKNLYDSDMKLLNKDIHNKIYTLCLLFLSGTEEGISILYKILWGNEFFSPFHFGLNWDTAEIDYSILDEEDWSTVKKIENKMKKKQLN